MEHINPIIKKRRKTRKMELDEKGVETGKRVTDKKGLEVLYTISNPSEMVDPDIIGENADDFQLKFAGLRMQFQGAFRGEFSDLSSDEEYRLETQSPTKPTRIFSPKGRSSRTSKKSDESGFE